MPTKELEVTMNCAAVLDDVALSRLPGWLADNPFGHVTELIDDSDGASGLEQVYSPEALLGIVHANPQWRVTLSDLSEDSTVIAHFHQRGRGATVSIRVKNARLAEECERFVDYAVMWIEALPEMSSAYIYDSAVDIATLHQRHNIARPPACFTTHLRWVHFLAPRYYSLFLTTEELLNTPAYKVERMQNDIVVIQAFADPFASADPENVRRVAVIVDYLKTKDRFMDNMR